MRAGIYRWTTIISSLLVSCSVSSEVTFATLPGAIGGNDIYPDKMEVSREHGYITHFDVIFNAKFDDCEDFLGCIRSEIITFALPSKALTEWQFSGWKFMDLGVTKIAFGNYSEDVRVIKASSAEITQLFYLSETNALLGFSGQFTEKPFAIYYTTSSRGLPF